MSHGLVMNWGTFPPDPDHIERVNRKLLAWGMADRVYTPATCAPTTPPVVTAGHSAEVANDAASAIFPGPT